MYYHASNVKGIKKLKPHKSMHGKSFVYFSSKRENILVYLSNPVEKFIKEKYNRPMQEYKKWATYGFTSDGKIRLEEYYKNALIDTFKGVCGYIYRVDELENTEKINNINNVFVIDSEVNICGCEEIEDAYEEILKAEAKGLIEIQRFETISDKKKEWIKNTITNEYKNTDNQDYKEFLLSKFDWLSENIKNKEQDVWEYLE